MAIFGERLVAARKEAGLTQYLLAEKLQLPRSTISGYETEGKEAPYAMLARIATLLGVTTDYLTGKSDKRTTAVETVVMGELSNLQRAYDAARPAVRSAVAAMLGDVYAIMAEALDSESPDKLAACAEFLSAARRMYAPMTGDGHGK
ncbi:MAG: helix-turn-helix transcriptional regulator [Alphaproteobacteria bacterium]|nr:helix-turn-helix transcriptional regulator [Alphaproteobacteria bacterium]